ncbi:LysR family transcriptional regulator [Luteibacter aegosomaticola]|uniref:LysR family transcriptional regulator n=1 Tax=Luteibacter aegosomaticola TaxID=2911538 RepID=UPI001FF7E00B|nr:LysR family transcriptional regulator [Luteibacter aegosomaticola]UPG89997.1 LysR family transcriptional regulator [Luteibacter aegosomaticola]
MSLNLRSIQLYLDVLDLGNFSEVARREGMSPSSVSRIIHQLETELGTQLLYRNTRAIIPTEAGRHYGESFRRVVAELDESRQQLRDREDVPGGLVRINAPVVFGQKHIAPWLSELFARYPQLQVDLVQTDDFIDPLTDAADILFRIGPLADSGFHARIVDRPAYHLVATQGYIDRFGAPASPRDLLQHNCLVYKGVIGAQKAWFRRPGGKAEMLSLSGSLTSNNAETLLNAALGGAGIIMMPDWQVGELLRQGRFVKLLPDYLLSPSQDEQVLAMLYPHSRYLPLNVRTVLDFFVEKFGEPPYWKYA